VTATDIVGALDIGGTHVTAGLVDLTAGSVERGSRLRASLPAGGTRSELLETISRTASSIARPGVSRLGVAVPGPFDYSTGVSKIAHKLQGLHGVDLRAELSGTLALTDPGAVRFLNDAEAFLLGEWWAGAARGHARAVGITLGTGLGSAFLAGGRIVHTGPGVPPGGALYVLQFRGAPVEHAISSRGLLRRYDASPGDRIDVAEVAARARANEPAARLAFEDLGRTLGAFLSPWLRAFEPDCLVVGGAIARSWDLLEDGLRAELQATGGLRTVTAAEQLDDAPLLGAAWHVASGQP
jgi:glucokinase